MASHVILLMFLKLSAIEMEMPFKHWTWELSKAHIVAPRYEQSQIQHFGCSSWNVDNLLQDMPDSFVIRLSAVFTDWDSVTHTYVIEMGHH